MAAVEGIKDVEMNVPIFAFNGEMGDDVVTVVTSAPTLNLFQDWFNNLPPQADDTFTDIRMLTGMDKLMYSDLLGDLDEHTVIVFHQSPTARDQFATNQSLDVVPRVKAIHQQIHMETDEEYIDSWATRDNDIPLGELHELTEHDPFDTRTEEQKEAHEKMKKAIEEAEKRGTLTGDSWGGTRAGGIHVQGVSKDGSGGIDVSGVYNAPKKALKTLAKAFHIGGAKFKKMFKDASPRGEDVLPLEEAIELIRSKILDTISQIDNLDMDPEVAKKNFTENFDKVIANFVNNHENKGELPDELADKLMNDLEEYSKSFVGALPEKPETGYRYTLKGAVGPVSGRNYREIHQKIEASFDDEDEFMTKARELRNLVDPLFTDTIDKIYPLDDSGFQVEGFDKEGIDEMVGFDVTTDFDEEFTMAVIAFADINNDVDPEATDTYDQLEAFLEPRCNTYVLYIQSILEFEDNFSMDDVKVIRGQHESEDTLMSEDDNEEKTILSPEDFYAVLAGDGSTTMGNVTGQWNTPDPERLDALKKEREEEQKQMQERAEKKRQEMQEQESDDESSDDEISDEMAKKMLEDTKSMFGDVLNVDKDEITVSVDENGNPVMTFPDMKDKDESSTFPDMKDKDESFEGVCIVDAYSNDWCRIRWSRIRCMSFGIWF